MHLPLKMRHREGDEGRGGAFRLEPIKFAGVGVKGVNRHVEDTRAEHRPPHAMVDRNSRQIFIQDSHHGVDDIGLFGGIFGSVCNSERVKIFIFITEMVD